MSPAQSLQYYRVSPFAIQSDLAFRSPNDGRHSFTGRVELADIQNLKLLIDTLDLYENRTGLARLKST